LVSFSDVAPVHSHQGRWFGQVFGEPTIATVALCREEGNVSLVFVELPNPGHIAPGPDKELCRERSLMIFRMFWLAALGFALVLGTSAQAAQDVDVKTHDGKVVSVTAEKLVMTGRDGEEHSHTLGLDAKVSCDGNMCKLEDLKPGMKIRVTTKKDDRQVATRIEALDKNEDFEKRDK
jgi:hypothetical protein